MSNVKTVAASIIANTDRRDFERLAKEWLQANPDSDISWSDLEYELERAAR